MYQFAIGCTHGTLFSNRTRHVESRRIVRIVWIDTSYNGTEYGGQVTATAGLRGTRGRLSALSSIAKNMLGPRFSFVCKISNASGIIILRMKRDRSKAKLEHEQGDHECS